GSQSCNTCGVQTTQACVGGRWVSQLGECSKTVAECETPECTEGAVSGSQSCNTCGTQTTQKCVNGKWESFLGACSKTVEECTENEDCCSYMKGSAEAQACLKKKYGANSLQAKCSNYGNRTSCLRSIYAGGSELTYRCLLGTGDEDLKNDRNGFSGCKACKANEQVNSFFNTGFLNYACTSVPKCDIKFTNPSGGEGRFSCCRVYEAGTETFIYSNMGLQYSECVSKCNKNAKCPDTVKPGVYLNGSKGGLDCWTSCDCPFDSNRVGQTFYGKRTYLKCKNEGKYCTNDEAVWW
ncbi:hypothetical protein, partial [Candidatus Avelusimicrobium faecicola]|uniref:hypothetical protein n=1 Tax=Candidatus Avelusimicrobium faecicola TaxID=3416205 RepID=UPI003D1008B5